MPGAWGQLVLAACADLVGVRLSGDSGYWCGVTQKGWSSGDPLREHACEAPCKGVLVAVDKRPLDQMGMSQCPLPHAGSRQSLSNSCRSRNSANTLLPFLWAARGRKCD